MKTIEYIHYAKSEIQIDPHAYTTDGELQRWSRPKIISICYVYIPKSRDERRLLSDLHIYTHRNHQTESV